VAKKIAILLSHVAAPCNTTAATRILVNGHSRTFCKCDPRHESGCKYKTNKLFSLHFRVPLIDNGRPA